MITDMDNLILGLLSNQTLSESFKQQMFMKNILPCKNQPIAAEDCKRLFEMAWTMASLPKSPLEKEIGIQAFLGWVPHNKGTLENWLTEEKIQSLLCEEYITGDKGRLFLLLACILENLDSPSVSAYMQKFLKDCAGTLFRKPLDLKGILSFVNFIIKFPDCWSTSYSCLQVLNNIAHLQIRWPLNPSDQQDIEYAAEYIKTILNEEPFGVTLILRDLLCKLLSSTTFEPSFTVAAVIEVLVFDPVAIEEICEYAVNITPEDDCLELFLSRNFDWLHWPHSERGLQWIFLMFRSCYKSGRHSVLLKVFETRIGHVLANIIYPSTRKASFKVLQYMIFTHQHVPTIIQRFHELLPNTIMAVKTLSSENQNGFLHCANDLQKYLKILVSGGAGVSSLSSIQMKDCYEDWLLDHRWLLMPENNFKRISSNHELPLNSLNLVGLENLGNTCYMNSIIQALNMTLSFRRKILEHEYAAQHTVLVRLQETFTFLLLTKRPVYSPNAFVEASRPRWLQRGEQQDSQEYLNHLLDQLHELTSVAGNSPIKEEFGGISEIRYTCCNCKKVSVVVDNFFNLLLPFPVQVSDVETNSSINLEDMLAMYLQPEVLDGRNLYKCDNCKVLHKAERTMCLRKAPKHLVLTLLRFEFSVQRRRRKLSTPVDFPKVLNLPVRSEDGVQDIVQYSLYAAVIHSGMSVDNGHFYTYACSSADLERNASVAEEKWFLFNDEKVSLTQFEFLQYKCAKSSQETVYMLFYIQDSQRLPSSVSPINTINRRMRDVVLMDNLKFRKEEELKSKMKQCYPAATQVVRRRDDSDDNSPGTGGCGLGGGFGGFDLSSRIVF